MDICRTTSTAFGVLCGLWALTTAAWAEDGGKPLYSISKVVPIGAPDHWDLLTVDASSHRVYIAHGDRVTVVDGQSGALIGQVQGYTGGTHGVALVPALGRGYTDDGDAGVAGTFNLHTLRPLKSIKAEADADAISYEPVTGHVFVVDSDPGKITVIDPRTDQVLATLDGGGKLEISAVDGVGKVYINGEARREILRVDARTSSIDARWPIPECESPHGIAVDAKALRIFSSCANKLMVVVDGHTGRQLASLPIGARTDGAAFDPLTRRAFSSNGDGTLTVIGEQGSSGYVLLGTVATMLGARTMAVDPGTGRLYLVAADMTLNESADPKDYRHRYRVTPGSAKLLFLDRN
jgi:DNA-binding beta-propeller fold protein YncE